LAIITHPAGSFQERLNIPHWILYLLTLLFGTASLLAFQKSEQRGSNLLVAVIIFSLAIAGAWIALRGSARSFSGGISGLAPQINLTLTRIVYAAGAALNLGLGIYTARRYCRK
jgi:hypothetical protein